MPRHDPGYEVLPPRAAGAGLLVASIIVWGMLAVATLAVGVLWLLMMRQARTSIDEAAVSAMAAAALIGAYCLARAADKILFAIRTLREPRDPR